MRAKFVGYMKGTRTVVAIRQGGRLSSTCAPEWPRFDHPHPSLYTHVRLLRLPYCFRTLLPI